MKSITTYTLDEVIYMIALVSNLDSSKYSAHYIKAIIEKCKADCEDPAERIRVVR